MNYYPNLANLKELQKEIGEWSDSVFGFDRDPHGALSHMLEEVGECIKKPQDDEEYADVFMLFLDALRMSGISLRMLMVSTHQKLIKNKERKWDTNNPDKDGVVHHVRKNEVERYIDKDGTLHARSKKPEPLDDEEIASLLEMTDLGESAGEKLEALEQSNERLIARVYELRDTVAQLECRCKEYDKETAELRRDLDEKSQQLELTHHGEANTESNTIDQFTANDIEFMDFDLTMGETITRKIVRCIDSGGPGIEPSVWFEVTDQHPDLKRINIKTPEKCDLVTGGVLLVSEMLPIVLERDALRQSSKLPQFCRELFDALCKVQDKALEKIGLIEFGEQPTQE